MAGPDSHPEGGAGSSPPAPAGAGRLLWRCRRGMKELDVLLERFARRTLPSASAEERGSFEGLLGLPDPVLAEYLLGARTPPEPHWAHLVRLIRGQFDGEGA